MDRINCLDFDPELTTHLLLSPQESYEILLCPQFHHFYNGNNNSPSWVTVKFKCV